MYSAMKAFTEDIYRPRRRQDSSLWAQPVLSQEPPHFVFHSIEDLQATPPLSSPLAPFVLRLEDEIGRGAVGSAYRGFFPGVSVPIVVKILPVDCMDRELEIWRRLRHLAGITIPGLYYMGRMLSTTRRVALPPARWFSSMPGRPLHLWRT